VGVSRDVKSAEQRQVEVDAAATSISDAQRVHFTEAAHAKVQQAHVFRAQHTHRGADGMPRAIADAIQFRLTGQKPQAREAAVLVRKNARAAVKGYQRAQNKTAALNGKKQAFARRVEEGTRAAVACVMSDIALTRRRHVHRAAFGVKDRPADMQGDA
jgi:2-phospho-L-lactate guanylyltransferase (CobY/MobA/RfbA family)